MGIRDVKPIVLRDFTLKFTADDYAKAVSNCTLTPSASTQTLRGGKPDAAWTFATVPTWTCALTYAQDWETPDSLSRYLFTHQGETVSAVFAPDTGGTEWAVDLVILPGTIGGAVDAPATSTVTLGVSGVPVPTYLEPEPA